MLREYVLGPEHVAKEAEEAAAEELYYGVGLVVCAPIPKGTEITWYYGPGYRRTYPTGDPGVLSVEEPHPFDVFGKRMPLGAVCPILDEPSEDEDE